jgi:DNA-binding beta-propeller fold protein YncE
LNQNFFSGVPMSVRRLGWLAAMALAALVCVSCGQVYRPVVIPVSTTPPNPANFHAVFGISTNVAANPGTAMQIDVSGDSNIGVANMGINPTHAATLPNNSRVFVASAGSLSLGGTDIVTAFTPAADSTAATGLGTPTVFTLPNIASVQSASIVAISEASNLVTVTLSAPLSNAQVGAVIEISGVGVTGYDGSFPISFVNGTTIQYANSTTGLAPTSGGTAVVPIFCSYLPDYLTATGTSAVYLANYGVENGANCNLPSTDSVAVLDLLQNSITNIVYLGPGTHPIALAETPDAQNLYVLNQGNNTVTDLSPVDLSNVCRASAAPCPISAGNTPVWAVSRPDSKFVYVVTQGDGNLLTINTATNTVTSTQSVGGPGANFVLYDNSHNRLYVTNPGAGSLYVFDATTNPPTPLGTPTGVVTIPPPPPCAAAGTCNPVTPVSITALPDGSRFYVASYTTATGACPDHNVRQSGCVIPQLTVFDAGSLTVKPISSSYSLLAPSISLLAQPQFAATQYALPPVASCAPPVTYAPGSTRFRMFTAAAADSSHVYVSICDAGSIADISATTSTLANGATNTPDQLVTDLLAPFSAAGAGSNGQPVPQNPVFLLSGQ